MRKRSFSTLVSALVGMFALWISADARAVPSFARQSGLPCAACHTTYPELTQFGRTFKLNGYTFTGIKQIEAPSTPDGVGLRINEIPPLSAMLQLSSTTMKKKDPAIQNDSVGFPQAASLFFAGEIADHLGTFLQMTYSQDTGKFGWDNTDVRYAIQKEGMTWGLTLNNNPSVQDVWHTTPAWSFPFASSAAANAPAVSTLIDGTLAQDVGGIGTYALFANHLYVEVTAYRSAHQGTAAPEPTSTNTINGLAPYWRLAWQQNFGSNYLMVGTYGLIAKVYPTGISGDTDKFTDNAIDAQYERVFGSDSLVIRSTYIHEKKDLDATFGAGLASNASDTIRVFKLNGTYHFGGKYSASLAHFQTTGSSDPLLYTSTTNANGVPNSSGEILQASYLPWQNVQVTAQYTIYDKFNGAQSDYDGAGRNASDNDTLYVLLWLMW